MKRRVWVPMVAVVAVALASLAACDPLGPLQVLSEEQRLESIMIAPDSTDLKVGDSIKVVVTLVGKGGGNLTGQSPVLTVGNPFNISVNASQYVKGLRVGRSEVLATAAGVRGSAVIRVIP